MKVVARCPERKKYVPLLRSQRGRPRVPFNTRGNVLLGVIALQYYSLGTLIGDDDFGDIDWNKENTQENAAERRDEISLCGVTSYIVNIER